MANNRMYLLHRPTGLAICLGKRMAFGWYQAPEAQYMEAFYQHILNHLEKGQDQDDFVLAMEDCSNSSCFADWDYGSVDESGFMRLREKSDEQG